MFPRAAPDADAGPDDISAIARRHGQAAVEVLINALRDPDVGTRIAAAERLLAVAYGAPVTPVAIDGAGIHVAVHGFDAPGARPNGADEPAGWEQFRERRD
jgi:hypothetical protein